MPTKPFPAFVQPAQVMQVQPQIIERIVQVQAPAQQTRLDPELSDRLHNIESLLKLLLLASGGSLPTTSVATNFVGDLIGTTDRYLELYRNRYPRPVSLKVAGDFVIPGSAVDLSLSPTNNDIISILDSNGQTVSDTIILPTNGTLWINTADTAFSLNGSNFRVLLFDGIGFVDGL
jgi:hypothetical protein